MKQHTWIKKHAKYPGPVAERGSAASIIQPIIVVPSANARKGVRCRTLSDMNASKYKYSAATTFGATVYKFVFTFEKPKRPMSCGRKVVAVLRESRCQTQ